MTDDTLESFDASDTAAEANARRDAARRERNDLDVLRTLMHTRQGRDWLYRFLDACHINNTPFAATASETVLSSSSSTRPNMLAEGVAPSFRPCESRGLLLT